MQRVTSTALRAASRRPLAHFSALPHSIGGAVSAPSHRTFSSVAAKPPASDARTQPPTLLFPRSATASGPAAPASCPLTSLSHLHSLDPTTRSRLFELTFLGTSSGRPTVARNVSSVALRIGRAQRMVLFDCGEGTVRQLARCSHLRLSSLTAIFITHLHGDHVWGLCPLISLATRSKSTSALPSPLEAGAVPHTLHVFGPRGIAAFVKSSLLATQTWVGRPVLFHELLKNDTRASDLPSQPDVVYHQNADYMQMSMQVFENSSMRVSAAPLRHRDMQCWGYVVEEQTVTPRGETRDEHAELVKARKLVVLGDTSDSSGIRDVAQDADALVHEATFLDAEAEQGLPYLKGHSSARMAGAFAKSCNAHHLLLTHFSKRYAGVASVGEVAARETAPHVQQASEAAGHTRVYAAQDFQVYHVAAHTKDAQKKKK